MPTTTSTRNRFIASPRAAANRIIAYRHTFGSHLAQKGVSFCKISEMMGNSPEICRKHYATLTPQEMHREVEF